MFQPNGYWPEDGITIDKQRPWLWLMAQKGLKGAGDNKMDKDQTNKPFNGYHFQPDGYPCNGSTNQEPSKQTTSRRGWWGIAYG